MEGKVLAARGGLSNSNAKSDPKKNFETQICFRLRRPGGAQIGTNGWAKVQHMMKQK
jgi:hypothetical protein